jgi:hypothetical protein
MPWPITSWSPTGLGRRPRPPDGMTTSPPHRGAAHQPAISPDLPMPDGFNRGKTRFLHTLEGRGRLYSPDMNPIAMAFAKLKTLLRHASERTVDGLWRRIGALLDHFTPTNAPTISKPPAIATHSENALGRVVNYCEAARIESPDPEYV